MFWLAVAPAILFPLLSLVFFAFRQDIVWEAQRKVEKDDPSFPGFQ